MEAIAIRAIKDTDEEAIKGIDVCQRQFVEDHVVLYAPLYPGLTRETWFRALSCGCLKRYLKAGVIVLSAFSADGEVVGYISCSPHGPLRMSSANAESDGAAAAQEPEPEEGFGMGTVGGHGGASEAPQAKINHFVVMPGQRGKGVGRLLFDALRERLKEVAPHAAGDLRIVAVELNVRAIEWYRRLGFVAVELYMANLRAKNAKEKTCPMVYVRMQWKDSGPCLPWARFFGEELCGERVAVLGDYATPFSLAKAAALPKAAKSRRAPPMPPHSLVRFFDSANGLHTIEDIGAVDLTDKFACGRAHFERPLHTSLGRSSNVREWRTPAPGTPAAQAAGGRITRSSAARAAQQSELANTARARAAARLRSAAGTRKPQTNAARASKGEEEGEEDQENAGMSGEPQLKRRAIGH